tara:strand:- start:2849 stop:3586 length:738 start_codon:yes stop_codon:yes gene_type:complete
MTEFKFPTEEVELPSKGLLYPEEHILSSGKITMKYMTAKEEDILTNQNYISKGVVLDKLLEALIVTEVKLKDLLIGDKNTILIASRILGYGKDYTISYNGENYDVDLTELKNKELDEKLFTKGVNNFEYTLPHSKTKITFRLLTDGIDKEIEEEIKGVKKINKNASPEYSTRMKHLITSVEGDTSIKTIRDFVDNYLLARDARALREYVVKIQPDVELKTSITNEFDEVEEIDVPISLNFFFPDV